MAKRLFHRDQPIIGLDISATGVKLMAVDTKRMLVMAYGAIDLEPNNLKSSLKGTNDYLAKSIGELLRTKVAGHLPGRQVAISIPTSYTYSRTMTIPNDVRTDLAAAVQLEAEQYIPVPVNDLSLDSIVVDKTEKNLTVLISAVPKLIVTSVINACEANGLEVVLVEPGITSVARLITQTEEGHLPTIIVDIGAAATDFGVLNKLIRITGSAPIGGNSFTIEISKKMHVNLESAHQLKVLSGLAKGPKQAMITKALEPLLGRLSAEIRKIMRYYSERLDAVNKVEQVILVGGGANLPGIAEFFTNELVMPVRIASPWQKFSFGRLPQPPRQVKPRFITAAGVAMVDAKEIWK